jgi:hypothetical protein
MELRHKILTAIAIVCTPLALIHYFSEKPKPASPAASAAPQVASANTAPEPPQAPATLSLATVVWERSGGNDGARWWMIDGTDVEIDVATAENKGALVRAWSRQPVAPGEFRSEPDAKMYVTREIYDCAGKVQIGDSILYGQFQKVLRKWTPPSEVVAIPPDSVGEAKQRFLCS